MIKIIFIIAIILTNLSYTLCKSRHYQDVIDNLGIVNGMKSQRFMPWLCSLRFYRRHMCGCSIYNATTILTAAHCLQFNKSAIFYDIGIGSSKLNEQSLHPIDFYLNHPKYFKEFEYDYDVAIIRLEFPIRFKLGSVAAIDLPADCTECLMPGKKVKIFGWGKNETNGVVPNDLYEADINIIGRNERGCSVYNRKNELSDRMFCAGHPEGDKDSCDGDSGGPLTDEFNEQCGIVSWGVGCAVPGAATVYTNICEVKDWILNPTGIPVF